jgi:hypothetical protein
MHTLGFPLRRMGSSSRPALVMVAMLALLLLGSVDAADARSRLDVRVAGSAPPSRVSVVVTRAKRGKAVVKVSLAAAGGRPFARATSRRKLRRGRNRFVLPLVRTGAVAAGACERLVLSSTLRTKRAKRAKPVRQKKTISSGTCDDAAAPASPPRGSPPPAGTPGDGGKKPPPPPEVTGTGLTWAPPQLQAPTVVRPSATKRWLTLDSSRDYVVEMPSEALRGSGGIVIEGGRNVRLIGGEIFIPDQGASWTGSKAASGYPGGLTFMDARRGLYLKNQTGTVHVEGLLIHGDDLAEGIDLDQRFGATVQFQNIRVEGLRARDQVNFTDIHPDVIQTWAGPGELRVDRLTGDSDYQGFFLAPNQFGTQPPPRLVDLRRVNLIGRETARHLLWQSGTFPIAVTDVWVRPAFGKSLVNSMWPHGGSVWSPVQEGIPPTGDFVPAGVAGLGYVSPGYGA